ncbi:hypothetical protein GH714_012308 [Hevea brasiliensis]|uniref:TPX2 C-terminal domain-containing protein n=1 Tax=Hevea brasiliensis TaxID=3981 RepID=A0A6A6KQ77_HEVBR|nr:hypothetical protein GH714_012308 [Hevea brasiliensis]
MAIETDHPYHRQASSSIWSRPELTSDGEGPKASPSQILDHGSISFGRYATETLAWEKFSVFTQNRCHEELEKFREPGLVAKKKAYFEEYYSKIRAMRALKAKQQEKTQTGSFQEGLCNATKEENNMEADALSEENMPDNANKIQVQDNDIQLLTLTHLKEALHIEPKKSLKNQKVSLMGTRIKQAQEMEETSLCTPIKRSETSHKDWPTCNKAEFFSN